MTYQLFKPTGSNGVNPISVPDNAIDTALYDSTNKLGVQLIGRNAVDYGTAVAQNTIQMVSNFSGTILPSDTIALQGQLWFNATSSAAGQLYVRVTSNVSGGILNWREVATVDSSGGIDVPTVTTTTLTASTIFATNITATDFFGGTFHGVATSAQYADLAERYEADNEYLPGTVVSMGGEAEITAADEYATEEVFGVISTRPGMQLNAGAGTDATHPYVAQVGRVPVNVIGQVKKGQRLVASATSGVAVAVTSEQLKNISPLAIIGRALVNKTTEELGQVLTAVGAR